MSSLHWTYCETTDNKNLYQGDIVAKTTEFSKLLADYYPYYLNDNYKYFIILTQSCDLHKHDDIRCKARYISLAPARVWNLIVKKELEYIQDEIEIRAGICSRDKKKKMGNFVESLINNNDSRYFFLYSQPENGLKEDFVASLRLSIALKIEHYQTILSARILQLTEPFRAKLGWLVGESYSRIGTQDWALEGKTKIIERYLEGPIIWVSDKQKKEIIKKLTQDNLESFGLEHIKKIMDQFKSKKEILLEALGRIFKNHITDPHLTKLLESVRNDSQIADIFK